MTFTRKNEGAVSPVIGVILMVAFTVILAAVIAAFVFGMAGNIQKTKIVSVTLTRASGNVTATFQGGQDAASLVNISYTANDAVTSPSTLGGATGALAVGSSQSFPAAKNSHIVGVATFNDGTQQVISDTYI